MKRQQQPSTAPASTAVRRLAPTTRNSSATSARNTESKAKPATSKAKTAAPAAKASVTRRSKPATRPATPPPTTKHLIPDLYSSIHALLHTMRLIEQHEEPLCSMHDELRRTGKLSAAHHRKLQQLVHELPAHDYQADLETLRYALAAQNL